MAQFVRTLGFRCAAAGMVLFGAVASAREGGAPIVYASVGPARSGVVEEPLHYGYGEARSTERPSASIDLRGTLRPPASPARPPGAAYASLDPSDALRGTARPEWLETERVGAPYEAKGRWYVPTAEPGYAETGVASWYGDEFAGRPTANGEIYEPEGMTAAHPTLPIPSLVQVTNLSNGREAILRVNDRGPFHGDRLIDVSRRAAEVLGFRDAGKADVHVRYLGPAPKRVSTANLELKPRAALVSGALPPLERAPPPPAAPIEMRVSAGNYFVQVASFADARNAERARQELAAAGSVRIDAARLGHRTVQRVRLGPWRSRVEAETARDIVAELGYPDAVVSAAQ